MQSNRYQRPLKLPHFTKESQERLINSRVLVVGCGGLGNPVLLYLAGAGIGTIGLVDSDVVQEENLHRQIIFREQDIARKKTEVAAEQIQKLNSGCQVMSWSERLCESNVHQICENFDIIVDCSDNFETRFILDDYCAQQSIPLVYGAIYRYEGQISVFNYHSGIRYRDLTAEKPASGLIPDCETGGVLGPLTGVIGSMQAAEVIKIITGIGEVKDGKLVIYDLLLQDMLEFKISKKREHHQVEKQQDNMIKEISRAEYEALKDSGEDFQLIDVREPDEFDRFNLGGELIPMSDIPMNVQRISRDKKVIVHCKAGMRSATVIQYLMQEHHFDNLYNLKNGIMSWQ
ncbi:MAG: ThiF family adenylyltransferase [Flavobacteriales bacterium]|nr:ThiF family adenylyltransferase [Flavobacteriales bacterium]